MPHWQNKGFHGFRCSNQWVTEMRFDKQTPSFMKSQVPGSCHLIICNNRVVADTFIIRLSYLLYDKCTIFQGKTPTMKGCRMRKWPTARTMMLPVWLQWNRHQTANSAEIEGRREQNTLSTDEQIGNLYVWKSANGTPFLETKAKKRLRGDWWKVKWIRKTFLTETRKGSNQLDSSNDSSYSTNIQLALENHGSIIQQFYPC